MLPKLDLPSKIDIACRKLPRVKWHATEEIQRRYFNVHRKVGKVYSSSATAFLKAKGIPIPPPRSEYDPIGLFSDQFFNYWVDQKVEWDNDAFDYAYRKVCKAFESMKGLKQVTLDTVCDEVITSEKKLKSSGAPLFLPKEEALREGDIERAQRVAAGRSAPVYAVAYYRAQVGKIRLVWALPLSTILVEGMFMVPIIRKLQTVDVPYTMGYTSGAMAGRMDRLSYSSTQYCLDWSKFDSTIPCRVLHACFSIVKSWFDGLDETAFNVVERNFCTCPILMPDGYIYKGRKRGVPSGSYFTQLIDSLANMLLTHYISFRIGETIQDAVYLGDDSVMSMGVFPDIKAWSKEAEMMGMKINAAKQVVTHSNPHYLGHNWGGIATHRPIEETIQRMATSERYKRFSTPQERLDYELDKAKALLVDNASAWELLTEYMAFLRRERPGVTRMLLMTGGWSNGTSIRSGTAKSQVFKTSPNISGDGLKVSIGQQMLRH
jgi:hypothetical protein